MARVRETAGFQSWFLVHVGAQVKSVTEAVALDAIAGCAVDSGDTVESIGTRYPGKLHGIVVVGGAWQYVEYDTAPHWITSDGRWSLRSDDNEYFGRRVWHPGTTAQPFMRPALYRKRRLSKVGP